MFLWGLLLVLNVNQIYIANLTVTAFPCSMTLNPKAYAFGFHVENISIVIKILICYFYFCAGF